MDTSPGPNSSSVPSSMRTLNRPDTWKFVWATWQLSVLAMGLSDSDHFQPGSKVARPNVMSPNETTCSFPLGKFRVSSGAFKFFFLIPPTVHPQRCVACPIQVRTAPGVGPGDVVSSYQGLRYEDVKIPPALWLRTSRFPRPARHDDARTEVPTATSPPSDVWVQ